MTNFGFFRERCKKADYFCCNIVLNDMTLITIESDLTRLLAINKEDVFYFYGVWRFDTEYWRLTRDSDFNYIYTFFTADWRSSYSNLRIDFLYSLHGKIDTKILNSYIPKLFEAYDVCHLKLMNEKWKLNIKIIPKKVGKRLWNGTKDFNGIGIMK